MKLKQLGTTLALVLICSMVCAQEGYKITLKTESADRKAPATTETGANRAVLYLNGWNNKIAIDSTIPNNKGIYKFKGKKNWYLVNTPFSAIIPM